MLSVLTRRRDYETAILDADITGPSIPKAFGAKGEVLTTEDALLPLETKTGIKMMSVNLLLEDETRPVVWRGPVIAGTVKQFWTDVIWDDVDYMYVDMPPGTGDVPLTVFQSIPLDGIIIVTTPQLHVFGESKVKALAAKTGIELLAQIPIDERLSALCDKGIIELMENDYLDSACDRIIEKLG